MYLGTRISVRGNPVIYVISYEFVLRGNHTIRLARMGPYGSMGHMSPMGPGMASAELAWLKGPWSRCRCRQKPGRSSEEEEDETYNRVYVYLGTCTFVVGHPVSYNPLLVCF